MKHRLVACTFLVGAAISAALRAQLPALVGDGPLLVLTTNALAEQKHEVTLHLAALDDDGPARPFWQNRDNADVKARLDRDHVLLASYGNPYALVAINLPAGTHRVLADGCPHAFITVRGGDVLHLGNPRDRERDNFFYATPWGSAGERRRLCDERFAEVPQIVGNLAVAIAEHATAVWLVSLTNATGRAVWRPPAGVQFVSLALSPGGQRLAIGCVQPENGKGLLTVVDTGTASVVRDWRDLPIQVSTLSSFMPRLEVGWHDDAEVVCSETRGDRQGMGGNFVFVRRDLATGEVTDESTYAPLGLSHRAPEPPGQVQAATPTFSIEVADGRKRLVRAGVSQPLATFALAGEQWGDLRIAPDGHSAIAQLGKDRTQCTLFTAARKEGRLLLEGFAYDATWLPSAREVQPAAGSGR